MGEAIEEALQRMGCPHPLQAHQIQGLDYQAVLPVVQWLVKRVLATLEEFGDQVHSPLMSRRPTTAQEHETVKASSGLGFSVVCSSRRKWAWGVSNSAALIPMLKGKM